MLQLVREHRVRFIQSSPYEDILIEKDKKRRKRVTNYISVLEGLLFVAGDDGITLEEASYILELEKVRFVNY